MGFFETIWICVGLMAIFGVVCRAQSQGSGPQFVVDPNWPKPLPEHWVIGQVSGVCVDAQDNVFIVNRNDLTDKERRKFAHQAPPYMEFDPEGNLVNRFGDWKVVPNVTHGCKIDYENNFWTAGNGDGIIQKIQSRRQTALANRPERRGRYFRRYSLGPRVEFESDAVLHAVRRSG